MSIYKSGIGDELINPENYNEEVLFYLKEEAILLNQIISKFETVVEAGCMDGRNLELIASLNKNYVGVDLENRYIEAAKNKHATVNGAMFVCDDIINLKSILQQIEYNKEELVVVFPFNSFGNVTDNFKTLNTLLTEKFKVVIFTYKNNKFTDTIRENYYLKSGFENLSVEKNGDGVRFFNQTGLNSKAFSEQWFEKIGICTNNKFHIQNFSNIGVAYSNFRAETSS